MKQLKLKQIVLWMAATGLAVASTNSMASAFMLWEQDAASIGNYHAGTAATANDASTAWYNPAGLIRIKNQQVIVGADGVLTDFNFRGTVKVNTLGTPPQVGTGQGGTYSTVPFLHYAAPISDRFAFGFSVDAPFGLRTDYGSAVPVAYSAMLTRLRVIDYTPSLGVAITDKLSVGVGVDIQNLNGEFDTVVTAAPPGFPPLDSVSQNKASDTAYGYRLGALYQLQPQTRVGINYRSQVVHHPSGSSTFTGPLAGANALYSDNLQTNVTLPAITSLSIFHELTSRWDLMGSLTYTQWSVFKNLILQNAAGIQSGVKSTGININIAQHYHNSWNYAIGANYHPNDKWIVRTGLGFDQAPTDNSYRNLQLPDSNRIAVALGGHYQATKTIGFDAGWTHIFAMNTRINNVSQRYGDEVVTTNGSVASNADVYGLQVKWDIV